MNTNTRRLCVVAAATVALGVGGLGTGTASPARAAHAARASGSWSSNYEGVAYGWTNDHAWAIASYATVATLGSGEIASIACDAVSDSGIGPVCDNGVSFVVRSLTTGSARLNNHGIWIAIYPHWRFGIYLTYARGRW
jgi:hypothetical protein